TVNRFAADTDAEVELVQKKALEFGAEACNPITVHRDGGDGGIDAANAVVEACERDSDFRFLYADDAPIKEKIETIATRMYGADGVDYMPEAEQKIEAFTRAGWDKLPICMAKTHLSLSHDPLLKNRPTGFRVPIRDIRPSIGAGFLYPILGAMSTMPGLSEHPAAMDVDIDVETGRIKGLF
ncbi:MAG TPA: formate--tetrahydrofolate ligase, partial [Actinobacteria bacterium]|nr:formate--tetrahydrofolate ligase [Actinomycetota bacterium]